MTRIPSNLKIALDVDGVLADVIESWISHNNKIRNKIQKSDITQWDFWKNFSIDRYDFYKELSQCWESWEKIPPTENNLSVVIKKLMTLGDVDIVTAREHNTNTYVKNWLELQKIEYHNYVSVIDGPQKAKLDYDVYIDDSPLNAKKFLECGKQIILYSQPWNYNLTDVRIKRISELKECIRFVEEFI